MKTKIKASKKFLSTCLALIMVASLFAVLGTLTASAVGTEASGRRELDGDGLWWYSSTKTTTPYSSGSGTQGDPYIINTQDQLRLLVKGNTGGGGKYYKLGKDIVLNDTSDPYWYEGTDLKNWIKGTDDTYGQFSEARNRYEMGGDLFRDIFDGDGHTISGLYINYEGTGLVKDREHCGWGLFPDVYNATFKNVKLKDVYIKSNVTAYTSGSTHYHGYGALVGIVHNGASATFQNVEVENVKIDIARPNFSSSGKPVGVGGIIGYSTGPLTVTDAIAKNVTVNIKNNYCTWRIVAYIGAVSGAVGYAKTTTLTNVITIGNMNPLSCGTSTSNGAVYVESGRAIEDAVSGLEAKINATNCYAIGAEAVHAGKFTLVSDEDTFINSYLSTFNSNKGESTNWSIKDNNMPMLKDLALLECDFSNYESAAEYGNSPMAASNWTRITDGGNKYLHGDLGNNVSTQNASFVIVPNDATGNGSSHTGYYTWGVNGPVKPGRIYRLAFKAKCSQASTMNYNLLFGYGYGAGSNNRGEHYDYSNYDFYNRSSVALTTSWQNFSTYFTAEYYPNNGGGTNRVIFQIDQNGMRNRTVDFDDFVITEVSGVAFKVDDNKYSAPCVAYDGDSIVLPEDPTRNGYFFEGWDTDEGNTSALNTATEKVGDVKIAYAHWRKTFVSHSLVLNDSIGLNFFVDLGGLTAEQRNASYMTFTITKGDSDTVDGKQVDFASAFAGETAGYYGFTYYLSSVQMAESITPTFHYGNGETHVGDPYAITDYIDYVNANSDKYDDNVVDLVNAMGNYGYYAQQYFTDITYTSMASDYKKSNYAADAYTSRKNYVSDKAITQNLSGITNGGSVGQFQYNLNLNSTTSILIKFHTANVTIAATKGGNDYTDRKNAYTASDCTLYLLHLPISQLGDNITVSGKVNGNNYSMQISGLTYVYGVLNSGNTSTALKNLASALCDYYTLARAYAGGVAVPSYLTSDYM